MLRLIVDNGIIQALAAECKCDRRTVSLALKGASSGVKAKEVRAVAIVKYKARAIKEVDLSPKELLDGMGCE